MRVCCRFIWNYENYHLSLYRVFHGIRLLRLRRLVVVRQSIFFMLICSFQFRYEKLIILHQYHYLFHKVFC